MYFVVPLTIPYTVCRSAAIILSRITLMMGMAPPTDASKRICFPACFARSKTVAPRVARACLIVETEQQRPNLAASTLIAEAADHAVGGTQALHFEHGAHPWEIRAVIA